MLPTKSKGIYISERTFLTANLLQWEMNLALSTSHCLSTQVLVCQNQNQDWQVLFYRVSQKKWSQRSDNIRWIIVWASMSKYTLDTRSALVHCKHKVLWYHSPGIIASPSAKQRSIWESWWLRRRVRSNDNIGPGSGVDESALRTKCAKLIWKVFMKMSLCILCFFELFCVCIW